MSKAKIDLSQLGKELGDVLQKRVLQATDLAVREGTRPLQIVVGEHKDIKDVKGIYHKQFPVLVRVLSARLPAFLVGEAGSGKTHLVAQIAESLKLPFYCVSVCAQTTASALLGYMDATGKYVRSLFREAYENGGVFLLDEVDNGNPNVLSVLNSSLSNKVCAFPDCMVSKHPDFILVASGNTYGHGANRKYVGRLEIDGATLDRFVFIDIGYDEVLEERICGSKTYAKLVQAIRHTAESLKMRNIISPRASIHGVKLLEAGMDLMDVLQATIFRDMSPDTIKQLLEAPETKKAMKEVKKEIQKEREDREQTGQDAKKKDTEKDQTVKFGDIETLQYDYERLMDYLGPLDPKRRAEAEAKDVAREIAPVVEEVTF